MRLAFERRGCGPALLLLHGVGGDAGNWCEVADRLEPRFTLLMPDLRGHGHSPPIRGPVDVHDLADDLADTLDAAGIPCCDVAGFSLGGLVAQAFALAHPARVRRLALIGTPGCRTDGERERARDRIAFLAEHGAGAIADANRERWFTDAFRASHPEIVQARVAQVRDCDPESYLRGYTVFATTDFGHRIGEIAAPMLVMTGEDDVAATPRMARAMQSAATGSALRLLPALRHSVLIEAPALVACALGDFLADPPASASASASASPRSSPAG